MNRREVFGLCALPLAGAPFAWSGVQTVKTSAEADFYRVLEDGRMAHCWQDFRWAYECFEEALKRLPADADNSLLAEILEERRSINRLLQETTESEHRHLASVEVEPTNGEWHFW